MEIPIQITYCKFTLHYTSNYLIYFLLLIFFTIILIFCQFKIQQNGGSSPQQPVSPQPNQQRPLTRLDSRSNLQYRQPFPNQPGQPVSPRAGQPIVRQAVPPGSQPFFPRSPVPGPGQLRPAPPPGQATQGQPTQPLTPNQQRPIFRPSTPFPRPTTGLAQRPPFQQRSFGGFGTTPRPSIPEEVLQKSQTLDSSEIDQSRGSDDNKNTTNDYVKTPSIAAMNNRSYSLSSNPPEQSIDAKEEARRRSISSVDSYGEGRPGSRPTSRQGSISGSTENLEKKQENEVPSRPESRSASRMNKIIEDDDKSPTSPASQKSPDVNSTSDSLSKSPVSKSPNSNRPQGLKQPESTPRYQKPDSETKLPTPKKG